MKFRVVVDRVRCKACELCVAVCPRQVLRMGSVINKRGYHPAEVSHPEQCIGCKACAVICPDAAIEIYRAKPGDIPAGREDRAANE